MTDTSLSFLDGNTVELHYWFDDKSHSMDAIIHNSCESNVLKIINEIANTYNVKITIDTVALAKGGLISWLKIRNDSNDAVENSNDNKYSTMKVAVVTALIVSVLTTPISTSISKVIEKTIDNIYEDSIKKELEHKKLELEVENLELQKEKIILELQREKANTIERTKTIDTNNRIKKQKSNYYEKIESYKKIIEISYSIKNENENLIIDNRNVHRNNFKDHILISDDLEPKIIEEAQIEIISPVLKKGKYKWRGYFNGESISFNMKSKEFKQEVQNGNVNFKNGTTIICLLILKKKIDTEGIERIDGYDVMRVDSYYENDEPFETLEGKKHKQIIEAKKNQGKLFD